MTRRLLVVCAFGVLFTASAGAQPGELKGQFRYAATFICGLIPKDQSLHPGDYRTTITAHNAGLQATEIRHHLLFIEAGESAAKKAAEDEKPITRSARMSTPAAAEDILAHGVRVFGCDGLKSLYEKVLGAGVPGYGKLIITSDKPLNVSSVHTIAAEAGQPVTGISFGQVSRLHGPVCGKKTVDLSEIVIWRNDDNRRPAAVRPALVKNRYGTTYDGRQGWMSYDANAALHGGDQIYHLRFCVCSGTAYLNGSIKSEGASAGHLFPGKTELWKLDDGNWRTTDHALKTFERQVTAPGDGRIEAVVKKGNDKTAIAFGGTLELQDGHIGPCRD